MAGRIDARLKELAIELTDPATPAANYVPYVVTGNLVFISGQVPVDATGLPFRGKVGDTISQEDAVKAARLCGLNILAALRQACDGNLDRVTRCVKLGGFVNGTPDFDQHPAVINGCSDLMVDVFGNAGKHARFALAASNLPFDVAVEIDAVFEIA
ncbi:RidA family protein [Pyruvatibacter sp.]|uniref:RidA family protein n=1 Tax=Pyruvatibacter sp. TaxID=1981328 RepID=UPI0032EE06F2